MLSWQHNVSYLKAPLILFCKCTNFYLILTNNVCTTFDLNTSQDFTRFVKGAQHPQFSFCFFFLEISETLKAHISGMKTDIKKQ